MHFETSVGFLRQVGGPCYFYLDHLTRVAWVLVGSGQVLEVAAQVLVGSGQVLEVAAQVLEVHCAVQMVILLYPKQNNLGVFLPVSPVVMDIFLGRQIGFWAFIMLV